MGPTQLSIWGAHALWTPRGNGMRPWPPTWAAQPRCQCTPCAIPCMELWQRCSAVPGRAFMSSAGPAGPPARLLRASMNAERCQQRSHTLQRSRAASQRCAAHIVPATLQTAEPGAAMPACARCGWDGQGPPALPLAAATLGSNYCGGCNNWRRGCLGRDCNAPAAPANLAAA